MKPIHRSATLGLFLVILLWTVPAAAVPVQEIVVQDRAGSIVERGSLTVVGDGIGVTSYTLIQRGDWEVRTERGARLPGTVLLQWPEHDLVVLEVPNLPGPSVRLARELPKDEQPVHTRSADGDRGRGLFLSSLPDNADAFHHGAGYPLHARAAPVFDHCNHLIGISREERGGFLRRRLADPASPYTATSVHRIAAALESVGVHVNRADTVCLPLEIQLERAEEDSAAAQDLERQLEEQLQQAEQHRTAAEALQQQLEEQIEQAEREGAAREELERLTAELEQARNEALESLAGVESELEALRAEKAELEDTAATIRQRATELERAQQESHAQLEREQALRQQQNWLALAGIGLLLGLVALALLTLRRRKALLNTERQKLGRVNDQLSAATATFPDVVLDGTDPEGQPIRIKLHGNSLIRSPDGQSLGRDPRQVDYVLNLPEISRRHLRFRVRDNELRVSDQGSQNGTQVNEHVLGSGDEMSLSDGDRLILGSITLHVHVLG
ncbi:MULTISPECIES: FHA domain-containing protein [unclassified Thioalkalivibrio]|uniref:FHA domain-containing protein n=1 Tax=unclassified Thioalkalivibrio TaxID=2621013 RepID=UPI0003A21468|nr:MULTISPECIES: FHA domain-containing protein [unclassified Thioalkalivibrio]